ncbi:MAG: hypothetical protein ABIY63_13215 [Fibrobacteria bacterium]
MSAHDPFIKLTHLWTADGLHRSSPMFLLPEKVREIFNGQVFLEGNYSFVVAEKAEQVHDLVITKLAENRQADTMGNS